MTPEPRGRPTVTILVTASAIIGIGAGLRIWWWWVRPPFWGDEAALAMNIGPKGFLEMGRPFVLYQVCPYGYLALSKIASLLLGTSERALRMLPLLSGIGVLVVVFACVRRFGDWIEALVALVLVAVSPLLVHFSAELKPYQTDALVASVLLLLGLRALEAGDDRRPLLVLGIGGAIAPWISLPAIFVLAGIGAGLIIEGLQTRRTSSVIVPALLGAAWLMSFGIHYFSFLDGVKGEADMAAYWSDAFAPFPVTSMGDLRWYAGRLLHFFESPGGFQLRVLAAVLWIAGLVLWFRRSRAAFVMVLGSIAAMTLASMLGKYPVHARLLLFLVPSVSIAMALPIAALLRHPRRSITGLGVVLGLGLLLAPVKSTMHVVREPRSAIYIDDLLAYLKAHWQKGDHLFLEHETQWIYHWYAWRAGLELAPIYGDARGRVANAIGGSGTGWERDLVDLEPLAGHARVWVITPSFRHPDGSSRDAFFTAHLDRTGRRLDELRAADGNLYLYDLR